MGRRRKKNLHLPPRLQRRGAHYYYTPYRDGRLRWLPLGADYGAALTRWAEHEGTSGRVARTVGEAIDSYLIEVLPHKAEATQREYRHYAARLRSVFGHCPIGTVRRSDVGAYLDQHPRPIVANREIAMLSSVYELALRRPWGVSENPCRGIRRNPEHRSKRHVTDAELEVLAGAREPVRTVAALIVRTALRKRDVLRIRLSDWDAALGLRVEISKTRRVKIFEATPDLAAVIEAARAMRRGKKRVGSLYLFARRDGKPYTVSGFTAIWQREIKRLGLSRLGTHALRARALTDARKRFGRDYAQDLADHADGSTTEIYVRDREVQKVRPLER